MAVPQGKMDSGEDSSNEVSSLFSGGYLAFCSSCARVLLLLEGQKSVTFVA